MIESILHTKINRLQQQMYGKNVGVFGAGNGGQIAARLLKSMNITPASIIDNDSFKWGKEIEGVEIVSLETWISSQINQLILVASSFVDEISEQLIGQGFKEEEDFIVLLPVQESSSRSIPSLVDSIINTPDFDRIQFHELAGQIVGNKQYLFDGTATIYPWGPDDLHELMRLTRGACEPQEILPFLDIIQSLPEESCMIELGAGWGFYSILMGTRRTRAKLILVEANPKNLEVGKQNMKLNGLESNSVFIHAAITNKDNQTVSFSECGYGSSIQEQGEYRVSTITMSQVLNEQQLTQVDILHMDIQGEEFNVLLSMKDLLRNRIIKHVFIGTHSNELHRQCEWLLADMGYTIVLTLNLDQSASGDGVLIASVG
ncbi:FkbM family methyltransferase [Paenibacillus albus]|uniref:FkbM family methyltransferase n=1 Tax=Paenibacillus albus TaxID=2495582 RepID=A0A3S8ZYL1_9BACL|nr:FkbM family methyltransferase [Paenibacillus albus]AZN38494.1 FkbM family methyltransferase [Paenibacillus albus]